MARDWRGSVALDSQVDALAMTICSYPFTGDLGLRFGTLAPECWAEFVRAAQDCSSPKREALTGT
jgi:hypothetical protein